MDISLLGLCVFSYLAGGIPSGYLLGRQLKGIDIREHGSGNPGAANVYRVVGKGAGLATLTVDALKGYFPVMLAGRLRPMDDGIPILCGALAIIGHVWTVFLGFRGGKGVATSSGVFLALIPHPTLAAIGIFILGGAFTGHISIGSMSAALAFPFLALAFHSPLPLTGMAFAAGALILFKHIPNFKRLALGKEFSCSHGPHLENVEKKP